MEGLLIAQELQRLQQLLPSQRLAWRFPDRQTFVLPLTRGSLWLFNRPPHPRIELRFDDAPPSGPTHSGFQDLLSSRAGGELVRATQLKLDRVLTLEFSGEEGFVETPGAKLVAELTGRNCNLILLDDRDVVLGAAREVHAQVNRFREVRAGAPYLPPPPYQKLDPRVVSRERLREALEGQPLERLRGVVDGVGPQLSKSVARSSGVPKGRELRGTELEAVLDTFDRLLADPAGFVRGALQLPDVATLRERERRQELQERVEKGVRRELELVEKRLADLERAAAAAAEADDLRRQGDLLLAFANQVDQGQESVILPDFSGKPVTIPIDPARGVAANAQAFYERARKREGRARQARSREPELSVRREQLSRTLASLSASEEHELEALAQVFAPRRRAQARSTPGARYRGPHGYTVLVGRSARENDQITFKVARSRDVWLHVQGYHGSHVIIQAGNKEVPFDTVLFAAQLAAAYSKAGDSENVPVDYTLRKNVWKVKGQPPGAVNFTRQKTVYVTPSRRPQITGTTAAGGLGDDV